MKMEIKIIKIEENDIGWFVIGLTYKSILEYLPLIQKEIEKDFGKQWAHTIFLRVLY